MVRQRDLAFGHGLQLLEGHQVIREVTPFFFFSLPLIGCLLWATVLGFEPGEKGGEGKGRKGRNGEMEERKRKKGRRGRKEGKRGKRKTEEEDER